MTGNYWIKLYEEVLDDSKMAILPDKIWRRIVELFLLAGRYGKNGELPDTKELAWSLRLSIEELDQDLEQIEAVGIIKRIPNGWLVVKFSQRQDPSTSTERSRYYRDRKRKDSYYGDENATNVQRNVAQITDTESDHRIQNTDTEADKKKNPAIFSLKDAENIYCQVTKHPTIPGGMHEYLERILDLLQKFGKDETKKRLEAAWAGWLHSKRKNGLPYAKTNPAWIDYAIVGDVPKGDQSQAQPAHKSYAAEIAKELSNAENRHH